MTDSQHNNPPEPLLNQIEYRGFVITINRRYQFEATIDRDKPDAFQSLNEAKAAIDNMLLRRSKEQKASKALAIPVLGHTGVYEHRQVERIIVRGIHSGNGTLLNSGEPRGGHVYPDVPGIRSLLEELAAATRRTAQIASELKPFQIEAKRTHSKIQIDEYDEFLTKLVDELETKRAAATEYFSKKTVEA